MADQKLIEYIKRELNKGFSISKVKKALSNAGYKKSDIQEAVKSAIPMASIKPKANLWLLFIGLAIIIVIILLIFTVVVKKAPLKEENYDLKINDALKKLESCVIKNSYYRCVAIIENNMTQCDNSKKKAICIDSFYWWRAVINKDSLLCEKASDPRAKYLCLSGLKNDASLCNNIQDANIKDMCIALVNKKEDACNEIADESIKASCIDNLKLINAIEKSDASFCDGIGQYDTWAECMAIVKKNPLVCDRFVERRCVDIYNEYVMLSYNKTMQKIKR